MNAPLVILGPTASGKSDVAMALAAELRDSGDRAEIVAVDAMQVYRCMDIGTAKPSSQDQAAVRHHGIDLVDPDHDFAVTEYVAVAGPAVADIERRGAQPILVAGTGLYLRALTDPLNMPGTWSDVRSLLEARASTEPVERLYTELVSLDPEAAAKIEPGNERRIVRALEVCLGSGRTFSSFGPGLATYAVTRFFEIGLRWSRPALTDRIERRVHHMIEAGLVAEVSDVLEHWPGTSRTARQALGYRELIAHLDGELSLDEAIARTIVRTRQYAVRQERWFRRDPRIQWIDITADPVAEAMPTIIQMMRAATMPSP